MVELINATPQQLRDWQAIQLSYRTPKELDALMAVATTHDQKAVVRFARRLRHERLHDIDTSTDAPDQKKARAK